MKRLFEDKKKRASFVLGISFLVAGASFALPSLAWLAKAQTTAPLKGLEGEARGSYFNGGDGSEEKPFEIDNAKQLYYFNWLQDLGYFNQPNGDKTAIKQVYFVLTRDIDASNYVLPPAGTKEYPFVGNFNGNGKTIQNLTISNKYSELKSPPVGASQDSEGILKQTEIVGFFGVVGSTSEESKVNDYTYDSSVLEIKNLGLDKASIQSFSSSTLVGLAAGYVNGTLSGVGINSSSILTKEGASPISDIAGVKSISEYSLVGYATEAYRSKTQVNDEIMEMPQIDNPNTSHGSTNWGGSVDMKQMYGDLQSERDDSNISQDVYSVASETVDVDPDGNEGQPYSITYSTGDSNRAKRGSYYFKNGSRKDAEGNAVASYGLTYKDTSSDKYIYIYGTPATTTTTTSKMTVNKNVYGYYATISDSGHYLSVEENSVADETDASLAASWMVPDSGSSGYVFSSIDGTTRYLNINGTDSLSLSSTASTTWTYDAEKGNLYSIGGDYAYYLDYDSSSGWTVIQLDSSNIYLTIKDTTSNYYIGYSGGSIKANASAADNAYHWGYNNGYYPLSNSTIFLAAKGTYSWWGSSTSFSTVVTSSSSSEYGRYLLSEADANGKGSGKMSAQLTVSEGWSSTDYTVFLYYSTSSFSTSNTDQNHSFIVSQGNDSAIRAGLVLSQSDQTGFKGTTSVTRAATYYMNPTYIPLAYNYDDNENKTGINGVSLMNTGYLVGGANYVNSTDYAGDIRIAEYYNLGQLYTSFNGSSSDYNSRRTTYSSQNAQVLTRSTKKNSDGAYTDNGWSRIKDSYNSANIDSYSSSFSKSFSSYVESSIFSRYDNARRNLQHTIFESYDNASKSTSTSLYGLHFMDASISMSHLTEIGKAVVYDEAAEARYQEALKKYLNKETTEKPTQEGSVYYDYEVPEDSIDFNLATEGYINFFGATYYVNSSYGTNDSFFSLNEVERDEDQKIISIKEIKKIYANLGDDQEEKPYLYSYDGSVPSGSDANHLVFDVTWISTDATIVTNSLYYFEIPVNPGEYALGSVTGKQGSYLLYLDIGTGAANYESVTIEEKTTSKIVKQSYPKGVDFTSSFVNLPSLTGGQSACVAILVAPAKKIDYFYEETTLTAGPVSGLKVVYKNDEVTVSGSDGNISQASDSPLTITLERTTIQTYSPTNSKLSLAYQATWTITGAEEEDEIQLYFLSEAATWSTDTSSLCSVSSSGLVSVTGAGELTIKAEGSGERTESADWKGPDPIAVEETFGELKLSLTGGEASVEYVYDEANKTYVITIHSKVDVNVKVLAIPSDSDCKITVNGTEVTAKDQTFVVSA